MENKNYSQYFEEQIFDVFKKENLKSLADDLGWYLTIQGAAINSFKDRYFRNFNREIVDKDIEENNVFINEDKVESENEKLWKLYSDIEYCNSDLKLFIANLYLLRPTINNPTLEKTNSRPVYRQNFSDWNYSALVSCCYEKLYNYWDRIGDVLALYLRLEKEINGKIYFPVVIDKLKEEYKNSNNENLNFLINFRENEFKEFNKRRVDVVHYNQFETTYKYDFIKFKHDEDEIKDLWKRKNEMPEYFKNHLELTIKGYAHCFEFIKEHFKKQP